MREADFDELRFFRAVQGSGARALLNAKVHDVATRRLSAAEVDAYLRTPVSDMERDEVLALRSWFCRRYPTGADRLAYARRTYRRWTTRAGPESI